MSLRSLLKWHRFTVQTNEFAGKSKTGAIERRDSWLNVPEQINITCNLQNVNNSPRKPEGDRIEHYGKSELELYWVIYHNHDKLNLSLNNRILIAANPKDEILSFTQAEVDKRNIRIFQIISLREPVSIRSRGRTLFEVYLKQIFRQSL